MKWWGRNPENGETIEVSVENGKIKNIEAIPDQNGAFWLSPGWIDLQVNGFGGYDLNGETISYADIAGVTKALHSHGVTNYLPTIITGSFERLAKAVKRIAAYVSEKKYGSESIIGIHLEGPYLSSEDGPRGAHPREYTRDPDWEEFLRLQEAAQGMIKMVTLAPERKGAAEFIQKLTESGVVVALGHTNATEEEIGRAVEAGAIISTHLGNGSHPFLSRHPNYIWNQLADDRLWATFIPDGHHLKPQVLKAMVRVKGDKTIFVSDTTQFGGMQPGKYQSLIGGEVVLTETGLLHTAQNPEILAGSAASLALGVENALRYTDLDLTKVIAAVSCRPAQVLAKGTLGKLAVGKLANFTVFDLVEGKIEIKETVVAGNTVYKA